MFYCKLIFGEKNWFVFIKKLRMEKICICCNFEMKIKDEIFYFIDRMILSVCYMVFFGFNSCVNLKKKWRK